MLSVVIIDPYTAAADIQSVFCFTVSQFCGKCFNFYGSSSLCHNIYFKHRGFAADRYRYDLRTDNIQIKTAYHILCHGNGFRCSVVVGDFNKTARNIKLLRAFKI